MSSFVFALVSNVTMICIILTQSLITLSFQERFTAGKMQDTSCAFYKIQQTLVKNPGILSQEQVICYVVVLIVGNFQLSLNEALL